jgi:hypothetical protein
MVATLYRIWHWRVTTAIVQKALMLALYLKVDFYAFLIHEKTNGTLIFDSTVQL